MGLETDLTAILRELVQYLECLRDAKLPATFEKVRESLLTRSKSILTTFAVARCPTSPEPYLNMNAGFKGLFAIKRDAESDLQEYVGAEEPQAALQEYYETFQEVEQSKTLEVAKPVKEEETDNLLVDLYVNFSASQTRSKCDKCGPLCRKDGRKLFVFEQYRACWVGLLGCHLLIYGSERDCRPCTVMPIRGYMARPSPNAIQRDPRRSESAFELFSPGNKTLQFVARTPKDMEQWVSKICQLNETIVNIENDHSHTKSRGKIELEITEIQSRDEPSATVESESKEGFVMVNETPSLERKAQKRMSQEILEESPTKNDSSGAIPPPLPTRIPRRLPSVPQEETVDSYEPMEDDEEGIYHKIEDLKHGKCYQNVGIVNKHKQGKRKDVEKLPMYDDVRALAALEKKNKLEDVPGTPKLDASIDSKVEEEEELYDDIASIQNEKSKIKEEDKEVMPICDNSMSLVNQGKANAERSKKAEETKKCSRKKSFLDKVRSKRESPKKGEKKAKRKTPTPPAIVELPMYDDVPELVANQETSIRENEEEIPEYNSPPPPRPIFSKGSDSRVEENLCEEIYDDVAACKERYAKEHNGLVQHASIDTPRSGDTGYPGKQDISSAKTSPVKMCEDDEHYKAPRSDFCERKEPVQEEEELYDDIAVLVDFTARRRESDERRDGETSKLTISPERKPWNRFVNSRKSRALEQIGCDVSRQSSNDIEDFDTVGEQSSSRMNTFQKLINKMEYSLGKASVRTVSTNKIGQSST